MWNVVRIILALFVCIPALSQRHEIYSSDVGSLQVVAGTRWQELPVIRLGEPEAVRISFDEFSHTYHRYTYTIKHLEWDFSESEELFVSDYISGFHDGLLIEDLEESINTVQLYTHYTFQIPNERCRLLMSGNYRVDVFDEDNGNQKVLSAYFMVCEPLTNVGIGYKVDTDIDVRKSHQQAEVKVDYSRLNVTDVRGQIKGYVLQNNCWSNAVVLPPPSRMSQSMLEWTHCRDLIFDAGNEYHKFEMLDIHRNSLNVESNVWDGERWHTLLWRDVPRRSYVYDETAKGAFYIRNTNNIENDVASEYVLVHFFLQSNDPLPLPVYVNGQWTQDWFAPQYEMKYDEKQKCYECVVPLKYGYYSYQYRLFDGERSYIPSTEGSFYETRNIYSTFIYYRGIGERTDRLVGFASN